MLLLAALAVALLWLASSRKSSGETTTANGFPAGLPAAVAQAESGGRQYDSNGNVIVSPAGAIGEMQLMPGTAAELGVNPYDAASNVNGGTEYLQQLYGDFNGNLNDTLAAYNWGPGNVRRAVSSGSPFPDSVNGYIAKVLSILNGGQS